MHFKRISLIELSKLSSLHVLDDPSTTNATSSAVKLVSATHALSNYSLSFTPGVPITPAQIRMNKDPALLVCKVIDNNPSVYREADRMTKILTDLIDGTNLFRHTTETRDLETSRMQARVYAKLAVAALSKNDFPAAYETCVNKLLPLTSTYTTDLEILGAAWDAFYKVGLYAGPITMTQSTPDFHDYQKMELLARAILICPKSKIDSIICRWTDLENKLLHREISITLPERSQSTSEEHRGFLATAAQVGRSVARTASPMIAGGHSRDGSLDIDRERSSGEFLPWGASTSRFGVRSTVKTGLTQGIGWLLGAPSQQDPGHQADPHS
jgi:hypothetical protein